MNPNFQEYLEQITTANQDGGLSLTDKEVSDAKTEEFLNKLFALMGKYKASIGTGGKRDGTCYVSVYIGNKQFEDVEFEEEILPNTEMSRTKK